MCAQWKQGQGIWEEYRDAACHWREKNHVAKAQLEMKLPEIWKNFFIYIIDKRQFRSNIGLLQDEDGDLKKRDMDKAERLNAFFASCLQQG